jgi:hypothetical protein
VQQAQVVTYGIEGVLSERLRELAQSHRCWLRETSQIAACRNLVATSGSPVVLVMALGRNLEHELALLEEVHRCFPATASIVIGEADNPALAGLAWELGATFALFPPMPEEAILEIVVRKLQAFIS